MSTEATGIRARCDECGGQLLWDAAVGRLRCDSCGALRDPPPDAAHPQDGRVVEHGLHETLARGKPRWDLGTAARQVRCNECGAVVEFPDGVVATRCSFCDSPSVLAQEARADLIAPESLVPFAVNRDGAVESFRTWLRKLWLRPSDLGAKASISELHGVYVPYWTFDCDVTTDWSADAGYHYWEETGSGEQRRRERRTRWQPVSGRRHDHHDDVLVCASRGVPANLVDRLSDFDTRALVAYAPQYLSGYTAESYAVDLDEGWARGQQKIADLQLRRCATDVPGDTHRNLRASHRYSRETFKHVLLPLWIAAFRYHDRVYRFLVNGQTGKVVGKAPWSALKIAVCVALAAAIAVALFLLLRR